MKILVVDNEENISSFLALYWLEKLSKNNEIFFLTLRGGENIWLKDDLWLKENNINLNNIKRIDFPLSNKYGFDCVINLSSLTLEEMEKISIDTKNVINYSFKQLLEEQQDTSKISLMVNHIMFFLIEKIMGNKDILCSDTNCKGGKTSCCSQCSKTNCEKNKNNNKI